MASANFRPRRLGRVSADASAEPRTCGFKNLGWITIRGVSHLLRERRRGEQLPGAWGSWLTSAAVP